jgi:hypothetical protein
MNPVEIVLRRGADEREYWKGILRKIISTDVNISMKPLCPTNMCK